MNVRVYPIKKSSKSGILASASIEIEGIVIKGFKILNGKNDNPWVSWPNQKGADGKYYDQVYALDKTLREEVEDTILDEYEHAYALDKTLRGLVEDAILDEEAAKGNKRRGRR